MESLTNSTRVVCWLRVEWCRTIGADEAPAYIRNRQKGSSRVVLTVMVVGVERPVRAVSASKDRDMDRKKVLLRNKSPSLSLFIDERTRFIDKASSVLFEKSSGLTLVKDFALFLCGLNARSTALSIV